MIENTTKLLTIMTPQSQDTAISPSLADYRCTRFNAIQNRNGSVSGHLTLDSRGQEVIIQGDVTCLVINGNEAIIGGIITQVTPNSDPSFCSPGQPFVLRMVDNGEGAPYPVDLVSDVNASSDCSLGHSSALLPIEVGNINVNP